MKRAVCEQQVIKVIFYDIGSNCRVQSIVLVFPFLKITMELL